MATENVTEIRAAGTEQSIGLGLDAEQIGEIRRALLIGLACYGQIEELINSSELAESVNRPWPKDAIPLHPTGTSDAVSKFATALSYIEA